MQEEILIYHNGECSKCRGALEILQERQVPHQVRWYLTEPLSRPELTALLTKLGMSPCDLIRQGEAEYKEFVANNAPSAKACLELLLTYPHLMERPIIETADRAIVARPAERMWEIIEK